MTYMHSFSEQKDLLKVSGSISDLSFPAMQKKKTWMSHLIRKIVWQFQIVQSNASSWISLHALVAIKAKFMSMQLFKGFCKLPLLPSYILIQID